MPNTGSFAQYRLDTLDPRGGPEGEAWATAIGGVQDQELQVARVAALARLPAYCPDDGLTTLGPGAFALEILPGERLAAYRARLQAVWTTYGQSGTPASLLESLVAYGFVDVTIIRIWQSPAPFRPETSATNYAMFYVFLGPNMGTTGIAFTKLGSCALGSCKLGTSATADQIAAIKKQVLTWKAAHSYPIKIVFLLNAGPPAATAGLGYAPYPMGRTLGSTMPALGATGCELGGYQ